MIKYKRYLVEKYFEENNISKKKFCKKIGIHVQTLYRFLKDGSKTNIVSAISICNGIGVPFPEFVEQPAPKKKKRRKVSKTSQEVKQ